MRKIKNIKKPTKQQVKELLRLSNKYFPEMLGTIEQHPGDCPNPDVFIHCLTNKREKIRGFCMYWTEWVLILAERMSYKCLSNDPFMLYFWQGTHPIDFLIDADEETNDDEEE